MVIALASYYTAFHRPGGGERQLLSTYAELQTLSELVRLYDTYDQRQWEETELIHIFSVCRSTELLVNSALDFGKKIIVSPIHWPLETEISDESERNRIRHILLSSDLILTNSHEESRRLISFYCLDGFDRFRPIPNGVDGEFLAHSGSYCPRDDRNQNRIRVLFCGYADNRKNLEMLAGVCSDLGAELLIAGSARSQRIIEQLSASYGNITFLGEYVPGSAVHYNILSSADVFCLPSLYETPGLAALEAAIYGLPVAITREGSTLEYFGDKVSYCNPYDRESVRQSILAAFAQVRTSTEASYDLFKEFNWSAAAAKTLSCYRLLLGKA